MNAVKSNPESRFVAVIKIVLFAALFQGIVATSPKFEAGSRQTSAFSPGTRAVALDSA